MATVFLGWDVSKGYADSWWSLADGRVLRPSRRFDDTPEGHAALQKQLAEWVARDPEVRFEVGLESTGGYERNWLHFFHAGPFADRTLVFRLAPLAVRRFREAELHHNTTDKQSAKALATYLQSHHRSRLVPYAPDLEGERVLYRFTANLITRRVQVQNELQSLLPAVHPELVRYCRRSCPAWVLRLLAHYPTASALAATTPAMLVARLQTHPPAAAEVPPAEVPPAEVPRAEAFLAGEPDTGDGPLSLGGATTLIAAAARSIGSLQDPHSGYALAALAAEVLRLGDQITHWKQQLGQMLAEDPLVRRLETIVGIGRWTAVVLRLEAGDFRRFRSAAALVAFAGLNPQYHESGDGKKRLAISKRGRPQIRAALYMNVLSAIQHNPAIRAFYQRLRAQGKGVEVSLVACMAKLLRIAYACVTSAQDFDRERYAADGATPRAVDPTQPASAAPSSPAPAERSAPPTPVETVSPTAEADPVCRAQLARETAPVSRREAQRRRAATRPQVGQAEPKRGPGATRRS